MVVEETLDRRALAACEGRLQLLQEGRDVDDLESAPQSSSAIQARVSP